MGDFSPSNPIEQPQSNLLASLSLLALRTANLNTTKFIAAGSGYGPTTTLFGLLALAKMEFGYPFLLIPASTSSRNRTDRCADGGDGLLSPFLGLRGKREIGEVGEATKGTCDN